MRRQYLKKTGLSAASLLITLVALEIGLRLFGYNPPPYWRQGTALALGPSLYPDLRYELNPGASVRAWDTDIKINSQGFRGPEPSSDPATERVIVLGDSITFGNSLALEDTFPFQLQQRLVSQGRNLEVLNFGVSGYDTLQEAALLEIRGLKYHPKLVVVGYCLNDIGIASMSLERIQRMQQLQNSHYSFLYESRLVQLISESVETIRTKRWEKHVNDPEVFRREYANQIDPIGDNESELLDLMKRSPRWPSSTWFGNRDRVGRLRYGFRRLARLSQENNFRVVIMIIPLLQSKGGAYSHLAAHRIVEMEARRAGFDSIDLTAEFLRAGMGNLTLSLGDIIHPNKTGHRIMADSLSAFINDHLPRTVNPQITPIKKQGR